MNIVRFLALLLIFSIPSIASADIATRQKAISDPSITPKKDTYACIVGGHFTHIPGKDRRYFGVEMPWVSRPDAFRQRSENIAFAVTEIMKKKPFFKPEVIACGFNGDEESWFGFILET